MHSPAMFDEPMDRYVRGLSTIISELDGISDYLERDSYLEFRGELIRLYLDAYYVAHAPYDQLADAPQTER